MLIQCIWYTMSILIHSRQQWQCWYTTMIDVYNSVNGNTLNTYQFRSLYTIMSFKSLVFNKYNDHQTRIPKEYVEINYPLYMNCSMNNVLQDRNILLILKRMNILSFYEIILKTWVKIQYINSNKKSTNHHLFKCCKCCYSID